MPSFLPRNTAHSFNVKVGHLGFVIDDVDDMDDLKDDLPFIPYHNSVLGSNEWVYKQLCQGISCQNFNGLACSVLFKSKFCSLPITCQVTHNVIQSHLRSSKSHQKSSPKTYHKYHVNPYSIKA